MFQLFVFVILISNFNSQASPRNLINIKIIEEPAIYLANLNLQNFDSHVTSSGGGNSHNFRLNTANRLESDFKSANFSGPPQLEELNGQCFDLFHKNYKWVICPFQNVTQYEQAIYKPYKGILGIWYEWAIKDNKFVSLEMLNGDECGSHGKRRTKIFMNCGSNETIVHNITETSTCSYEVDLLTPLACERHELGYTMRVYPFLSKDLQGEVDSCYGDFVRGFITEKMYNESLRRVYEQAGFYHQNEIKEVKNENLAEARLEIISLDKIGIMKKLELCEKENKKLKLAAEKMSSATSQNSVSTTTVR